MHRALRIAAIAVILAAGLLPAVARATVFGASVDGDFNYYARGAWSWKHVERSLRDLRATGATVARTGADWADTEPQRLRRRRPRFAWDHDDTIVRGLAEAHLRWEPSLDYTPQWAQRHIRPVRSGSLVSPLPPARVSVYAVYAAAVARRYGAGGAFWRQHPDLPREPVITYEIWNEPDCKWTWGPDVNLMDYARLYAAARRAIKHVDRRATVLTGGLAFTRSSLPRLLHAVRGLPLDAVAIHPYGINARATIALARWAQREMARHGRGRVPLIINEYGWNSVPHSWQAIPARRLAANVRQAIIGLSRVPHVREVLPFEWADSTWGLSDGALAAGIKRAQTTQRVTAEEEQPRHPGSQPERSRGQSPQAPPPAPRAAPQHRVRPHRRPLP
jgi:hypothetical protein